MKKISLLSVLCFVILTASSAEVDKKTASLVAKNFYYERVSQYDPTAYEMINVGEIIPLMNDSRCLMYAVNIDKGGFVIVSASMSTRPIAGYSFNGKFTNIGLPPQLADLLEQYKKQINYAIENHVEVVGSVLENWERLLAADPASLAPLRNERDVEPMITTQWDQSTYYNEMCPDDPAGPGGHCYTGCVATTLGQIVNYFRWPVTGTGSYSYSCPPYGTLTADYENTTYDYDMMSTQLTRSNLSAALLLNHLGIACDMVYGPDGSGMYNHKAAYALRTFFKYSPETIYVYRDSTSMDWDSLIITHLDRNIPLYYAGWSVPNINGHAFVCDGYQAGNYYHFNWGWSGSYDGYFYTDNLSPGGSNFNLAQELVINAYPDTVNYVYPYYCAGDKELSSLDGTIEDGSGPLNDYLPGAACSWLIAPEDSVNSITLEFLKFNTQSGDQLIIYDGATNAAPVLATLAGSTIPDPLTSSSDRMLLSFSSAAEAPGFLISYEAELPVFCSGANLLNDQSGNFSDGSGPADYHNGTQCIWMIDPPDATEVTLYFNAFNTEAGNDVLQIYDMATQDELAVYSGEITPEPVTSPSGSMFITFSSNNSITAPGWEAYYETDLVNIQEDRLDKNLEIFPNPANDYVNLSWTGFTADELTVKIYDITGKELTAKSISLVPGKTQQRINLDDLDRGIYLLKAFTADQSTQKKLIISR